MTSPSRRRATSMATAVFPVAVGPVMTSASLAMTAETPLQLLERKTDHGGSAVHVVVRQVRREQALEQLRHLHAREWLPGLDRALTRERHRNALVLCARRARQLAAGRELRNHVAQTPLGIEVRMRRRRRVHDHGAAAER